MGNNQSRDKHRSKVHVEQQLSCQNHGGGAVSDIPVTSSSACTCMHPAPRASRLHMQQSKL